MIYFSVIILKNVFEANEKSNVFYMNKECLSLKQIKNVAKRTKNIETN